MSPQVTLASTMSLIPEDGELAQAVEVPNQGNLCCGESKFVFETNTTTVQITQFSLSQSQSLMIRWTTSRICYGSIKIIAPLLLTRHIM